MLKYFRAPFFILVIIGFTVSLSFAQNFRFRNFNVETGMCDRYVYNIVQGKYGFLWLGTSSGICRYNGFSFIDTFKGDSIPGSMVSASFEDSRQQIWFGFDDGSLVRLEGMVFKRIDLPPGSPGKINGIAEDSRGNIIVATQDKGLVGINPSGVMIQYQEALEGQLISSLCITAEDGILLGTFDGLFLYNFVNDGKSLQLTGRFEDIPYTRIQVIKRNRSGSLILVGTEDEGLYSIRTLDKKIHSYSIQKLGEGFNLGYSSITDVYTDKANNLWIATNGEGVFELIWSEEKNDFVSSVNFNRSNGLAGQFVASVYGDQEGNIWFGYNGEGISALKDQAFSFYNFENEKFSDNILSLEQIGNDYWMGSESNILVADLAGTREILDIKDGLPNDKISAIFKDRTGRIWVGTSRNGLYKSDISRKRFFPFHRSGNSLDNMINDITGNGDDVWVATNGGVLRFNMYSGEMSSYTTTEGLPHNKIRALFADSEGKVWIATRNNGLYNINGKGSINIEARADLEFTCITEDLEGNLWAGTNGNGIFAFLEDSLQVFTARDGLISDFCYSLITDSNGNIWAGHKQGLSKIDSRRNRVLGYGAENNIYADCNYNSLIRNNEGDVVFGTSKGLIVHDSSRDIPDTIPPVLNIISLKISDKDYDYSQPVNLPYGTYKIRIDFIGIDLNDPEGVTYQTKLEGYIDEWSDPVSQSFVTYSLDDGKYTFFLKACDASGNCTEEPFRLQINIRIPVWKTWWFSLAVLGSLLISFILIIKMRERKQRLEQERLQKALDERTREVMEQKEEIENKNRDITDSINYAQRIQASILPPVNKLSRHFTGSFVYYVPRDIVSGDFYWYDTVWDNKFVIVCADSTGHGVPGAFMSMIGTTLIKDICSRNEVRSPADILTTLNQEVTEALNQNLDSEKSNDGMDIIVAEIDLKTYAVRLSSAMRPAIFYINGKQVYLKGSRSTVGGRFDDEAEKKTFVNEEFQLSKGDIIYMFSDGYPDQFGGPLSKKFKMVRLRNLLRDIYDKPMEEQLNYIKSNFLLWKEGLEQVDDVLFMGVKL